ncbi:MAG: lipopolysaccharide biosynthesis protein RfbH [Candidatus Contendobacter sp.]|nr:lipopolysaccharide biosynthesis protein RfbH [Candidatus Contendobacter sp.]
MCLMLSLGDIVLLDFPYANRAGSQFRPGLVIAVSGEDRYGDLQLAYLTTEVDSYAFDRFASMICNADLTEGSLKRDSVVRVDKVVTVAPAQCRKVAHLSQDKLDEVLRKATRHRVVHYAAHSLAPTTFVPGNSVIPPSGKLLDGAELQQMVEAALDGWLTTGRFNDEFERRLAEFMGVKHLITVNSGSSANLVAFSTLTSPKLGERAIRQGDEVIGVAAGFPTTVNPIIQFGAVPVFVDVELGTYNIDASQIEAAISPRTKAIMLAHTLGNPYNLEVITGLCKKYHLWLVEDCCDALGSTYKGQWVGTFGDIGTLSFYPAHHITMGEGGAVFTNNPQLKQIAESFRDWGRDCYCAPGRDNTCGKRFDWQLGSLPEGYDHKYTYSHAGYNLKITDMQAACGLAQLDKAPQFIQARKNNFAFLKERLAGCEEFLILPEATLHSEPSWFGFPLTLRPEAGMTRVDLLRYLDQYKIGTRLLFAGNLTRQPYFQGRQYRVSGELVNTDRVMNDTFWIGVYPGLTEAMLDYAATQIETFLGINFC